MALGCGYVVAGIWGGLLWMGCRGGKSHGGRSQLYSALMAATKEEESIAGLRWRGSGPWAQGGEI